MGGEGLTFSRRVQWTSEATRPSHHGSSIVAYAAPRSEATGLSGRTLRGHELPQRTQGTRAVTSGIPIRPRPGAPPPDHLSRAGGRRPSREGCGVPSPLFVGPGATWSCAITCRIVFPFAKVAEKVADSASPPEAGAPAAATGSPSPTPPPPPSLCPAPTSCPGAGAKLTHPSPAWGAAGAKPLPELSRRALAPGAPRSRRPPPQPRSSRRRRAPACARVPQRLAVSGPPGASLPR